jgi:DNA repair exonuclease SbcCD nuclease subunit
MVTKIIHTADIHIRNLNRMDEYQEQLQKFIDSCKKIVDENGEDETKIVIAGDIVHNKLDISGEGYLLASWLLKKLDDIAETFVIAGNHDINMHNLNRLDPLTAIFSMCDFKRVHYVDKLLDYQSGCIISDNIVWCLYSSFDNFARPDIDAIKMQHPNDNFTYVALFHGVVKNAKTDVGYSFANGYDPSYFDGVDFCLMGHIHKRQCLKYDGVPLVYSGSLIQQDHGENVSGHGFLLWDVESATYEEIDIPNEDYGYYTFTINDIEDIDEDKEIVINL